MDYGIVHSLYYKIINMKKNLNHHCEVCNVSSIEKSVCFRKLYNKYLCDKHYTQILKYGEFKDSNKRGVFDDNEIRLFDTYAEIDTYDQYGNLVETFILDTEDANKLNGRKWRTVYKLDKPYLFSGNQKSEKVYFHRLVLPTNIQVDHINGNTLDNRKINLRAVTIQENMKNLKKKSTNKSGIRGVSFSNRDKGYKCDFTDEKSRFYFKNFERLEQSVYIRYLCEINFLKEFRNTSNDDLYFEHINKLSNEEKSELDDYFKSRTNTSKEGV